MALPAIRVDGVCKTYKGVKAVNGLGFSVEAGTCFGLLGPNGAGKTTMMNMLYGKTRRDPGRGGIRVLGFDPEEKLLEIKFLSGIVPQENNLDAELTVFQNLFIYSRFYGMKKAVAVPRIDYLLGFMELKEKRDARIRDLSGGMQRRLVIARALINSPRLLILDEPTTGLDPQVRQLIWDRIRLLKQEGVTVVLCTHYMEEAFQICDRLMIMHGGTRMMEGNPGALVAEHLEPWVLEAFGAALPPEGDLPRSVRLESLPGRALLFSRDLEELKTLRGRMPAGESFLRQANLEDLFLKATGRHLNE